MTAKEKRKNLDPEELRAISRQAIETAEAKYQQQVDAFVLKIEKRLAEGKFITYDDGFLGVRFWGYKDWRFMEKVLGELGNRYSKTDRGSCYGGWGTVFKVKP